MKPEKIKIKNIDLDLETQDFHKKQLLIVFYKRIHLMSISVALIGFLFYTSTIKIEQIAILPFILALVILAIASIILKNVFLKKRKNNLIQYLFWNRWAIFLIITNTIIWISMNLLFFDQLDFKSQTMLLFSTAGIMCGATASYPSYRPFGVASILSLGGVLVFNSLASDNQFGIEFSLMFILFTIVMIGALLGNYSIVTRSLKFQSKQISLIAENEIVIKTSNIKDEFLANMSHEIRTPMNAIMGLSFLLSKEKELSQNQNKYINAICLNSKNLLGIINDVLDFSKIEAGKLHLSHYPFNIKDNLTNLHFTLEETAQAKGINLKLNTSESFDFFVNGDWVRINQILTNLISNSIKFTHQGEVSINVIKLKEDDKYINLKFSIKDTGIGIKKENIDKIIKPFSQENESTTRKFGGTGLGLSIIISLLDLFKSKLTIDSTPDIGSDFNFELTLEKAINTLGDAPSAENSISVKVLDNSKILIGDDNDFNIMVATDTILDINKTVEIDSVTDGLQIIEKLKSNDYNIIILDLNMPNLDGYDTIIEIRNTLNLNTPILVISGDDNEATIDKCLLIGANAFILKPIEEGQLSKVLITLSTKLKPSV